jgi:hypothetical protein
VCQTKKEERGRNKKGEKNQGNLLVLILMTDIEIISSGGLFKNIVARKMKKKTKQKVD